MSQLCLLVGISVFWVALSMFSDGVSSGEVVDLAVNKIAMQKQTGTLWRIRRSAGPRGDVPPEPVVVPLYRLQAIALAAGIVGAVALGVWALVRRKRKG